jgi:hypothetical protein
MGNTSLVVPSSVPVIIGSPTTPGGKIGATENTLVTANLPPYTPSGSIVNGAINISHNAAGNVGGSSTGGGSFDANIRASATISASQNASSFSGAPQGGTSAAIGNAQQTVLGTFYRKL